MFRILFVCMGNICRSPTAEGVFRARLAGHRLADAFIIDSAGIEHYHTGDAPDLRAQAAAERRGYDLSRLRARQVEAADFALFDLILAMDARILGALEAVARRRTGTSSSLTWTMLSDMTRLKSPIHITAIGTISSMFSISSRMYRKV